MMKSKMQGLLVAMALVLGMSTFVAAPVGAINVFTGCKGNDKTAICKSKNSDSISSFSKVIINLLLFVLGIISVIMIIVGGLRYTTSNGDAGKVKSAKDTILYSVVGLVVALLAYSIVNFVIKQF